jgi:Na+/proline symporter
MSNTSILIVTLLLVPIFFMTVGILYSRGRTSTLEEYIAARGSIGTVVGTATLVATALGVWILFSPAETSTVFGIVALAGYAIGSAAPIIAFIWIGSRMRKIMPNGHSLTEFVWHRYGSLMYLFTLTVMIFYMFVFLAAELTGIALAVKLLANVPLWVTAIILGTTTVAYTVHGGLRATMFTDSLQFLFILPLLLLALIGGIVGMGGVSKIWMEAKSAAPEILSINNSLGWETGLALMIGIMAANLFHQGYFQRVYAAQDEPSLRKAFLLSAGLVIPIVFIAGIFGIIAQSTGIVEHPSTALFSVVKEALPNWLVVSVLILAIALVMSSVDSLLNGLISTFISDLHRIQDGISPGKLLLGARAGTVLVATASVAIATQGYSVLYLFLIADLAAAAVVVPVFLGLYIKKYTGTMAIASALVGLILGVLFFPTPEFIGWSPLPKAGSLMVSFLAALLGSSFAALASVSIGTKLYRVDEYDFSALQDSVRPLSN